MKALFVQYITSLSETVSADREGQILLALSWTRNPGRTLHFQLNKICVGSKESYISPSLDPCTRSNVFSEFTVIYLLLSLYLNGLISH